MKHILLFLCALLFALTGNTAPACNEPEQLLAEARTATNAAGSVSSGELERAMAEARRTMEATGREIERAVAEARRATDLSDREIARAVAEARQAIDAAERIDMANQSLEELNKAAREQIVRELGLSARQRREFEPIYKAYREALDKAVDARAGASGADEATQKNSLKAKLSNIAATAQVKRDYVDKFAAVLTAEQIRRLYNTEGEIGTNIKRAAFDRSSRTRSGRLKGSGRMVTQDWGKAGDYTGISAAAFFDVTVSPTARTISVTADDNVIDYLVLERDGGTLKFRVNANNTENISVSVVVPASAALRQISAGSYGKVTCKLPLKGPSVAVSVSSYGSVIADIDTPGTAQLNVSSYGKFSGSVRCNDCELRVSSYGSAQAPVDCRNNCQVTVGSYAKFSNDIKASVLTLKISSGASVSSTLISDALTLSVDSYAKFSGAVTVNSRQAKLTVSSGGSFNGTFSGNSLEAEVGSYGKINLKGSAQVASAAVRVSSGAVFSAPELRVADYDLTVSNYAKADVWCSGTLRINASTAARITYDGPCRVESLTDNIRRRK